MEQEPLKLIIAGGRDYEFTNYDIHRLNEIYDKYDIEEVVSGTCRGVDRCGEDWARLRGIHIEPFPAAWNDINAPGAVVKINRKTGKKYNCIAGFQRNTRMLHYANALAVFPGGNGTNDMYKKAKEAGLLIFDFRLS